MKSRRRCETYRRTSAVGSADTFRTGFVHAQPKQGDPRGRLQVQTIFRVRYLANCWPVAVNGQSMLSSVTFRSGLKSWIDAFPVAGRGRWQVHTVRQSRMQPDRASRRSATSTIAAHRGRRIGCSKKGVFLGEIVFRTWI